MVDMSTLVGGPRLRVYRDALGIESGLVSHLLESLPLLQMPIFYPILLAGNVRVANVPPMRR